MKTILVMIQISDRLTWLSTNQMLTKRVSKSIKTIFYSNTIKVHQNTLTSSIWREVLQYIQKVETGIKRPKI